MERKKGVYLLGAINPEEFNVNSCPLKGKQKQLKTRTQQQNQKKGRL
jgi:hypothetical protein